MEKITTVAGLKTVIQQLEEKQAREWPLVKEQFITTYGGLKPVNLIKDAFRDLTAMPDFKEGVLNASLSLAAGYLSKKAVIGTTRNPLKQLFGTLLQMVVTDIVSKNGDEIRSAATQVVNKILTNRNNPV